MSGIVYSTHGLNDRERTATAMGTLVPTYLTEDLFWLQWSITAKRFKFTNGILRSKDSCQCPLVAVAVDLGIIRPNATRCNFGQIPYSDEDVQRLTEIRVAATLEDATDIGYVFSSRNLPAWTSTIADAADNPHYKLDRLKSCVPN